MKVSELLERFKNVNPDYQVLIGVDTDEYFVIDELETDYSSDKLTIWIKEIK